ncbi:hypothetical protein NQ905_12905 [Clostridioides difficile]|nr:hypothetical protein [Clostridioides difficile]HBF4082058.1 hypothetical protein [Clostridioides difficile]HBF4083256.1 hypothetical protein [Clostridioides difficile]
MKYYDLKELVPEITGVDEDDYILWQSTLKDIQRIDKLVRGISSYSDTNKIPESQKDDIVVLYRTLNKDREKLDILKKFARKKHLTEKESETLFDLFVNSMNNKEEREEYSKHREEVKSEELKAGVDKIISSIIETVKETEEFTYGARLKLLDSLSKHVEMVIEFHKKEIQVAKELGGKEINILEEEARLDKISKEDKIRNNYPESKKN